MAQKTIQLYSPHNKQRELHDFCDSSNPNFTTLCIAGRQAGKSMAAMNQAIAWASQPNMTVWYVAHKDSLALHVYKKMAEALHSSGLIKSKNKRQGMSNIVLTNGSIIEFKSAAAQDSLRGPALDYLIVDEASYIPEDVYYTILLPMLNVKGKKILIITTPKGKNWIHKLWLESQKDGATVNFLKFTVYDNPLANSQIIEDARSRVPVELFNQEYLAEWVDGAAVFRNVDQVLCLERGGGFGRQATHFLGIDIGMATDYTVLTIINGSAEVVDYDRFTRLPFDEVIKRIIDYIKRWRPKRIIIEANNQGLPVIEALKYHGIGNIETFWTESESKSMIINNLIAAFSGLELRCINDPLIREEIDAFEFIITPSGKVKYQASSGFHDDIVMSMALAWLCYVKNRTINSISFYDANFIETYGADSNKVKIGERVYEKGLGLNLTSDEDMFSGGEENIF